MPEIARWTWGQRGVAGGVKSTEADNV